MLIFDELVEPVHNKWQRNWRKRRAKIQTVINAIFSKFAINTAKSCVHGGKFILNQDKIFCTYEERRELFLKEMPKVARTFITISSGQEDILATTFKDMTAKDTSNALLYPIRIPAEKVLADLLDETPASGKTFSSSVDVFYTKLSGQFGFKDLPRDMRMIPMVTLAILTQGRLEIDAKYEDELKNAIERVRKILIKKANGKSNIADICKKLVARTIPITIVIKVAEKRAINWKEAEQL